MSILYDTKISDRYVEIDLLRGIAILMMIVYHLLFDLTFFGIFIVDVVDGFWRIFAWSCASLFLFIVGLSFSISYARASDRLSGYTLYFKYLKRGLFIISCGLLVSAASWIFLHGEGFIVFGILQCIGISVIIAPFFYRFGWKNFIIGIIVVAAGWIITGIHGHVLLLPLGFTPGDFWSIDYVPLLPWFAPVLFGMGMGSLLYPGAIRSYAKKIWIPVQMFWVCILGRHSLLIYLLHQPVMICMLVLLFPENILSFSGINF